MKNEAHAISFCFSEVLGGFARNIEETVDPTALYNGSDLPAVFPNVELREQQGAVVKLEIYPAVNICAVPLALISVPSLFLDSPDRQEMETTVRSALDAHFQASLSRVRSRT